MRFLPTAVTCLAVCGGFVPAAAAQDQFDTSPPYIALVDGEAIFERETVFDPAVQDQPLVPGDRLRTTRGRVEIVFPDGSALDVDEYSSFELQSATLIVLTSGRVLLTVAGANNPSAAAPGP